jgi:hypothetical protein
MKRSAIAALVAVVLSAASPPALAAGGKKKEKEAQTYFVEGMTLMGKARYAEACENFAKSQALDPGMGTQYRLAECYEKLGRLASAYEQFMAVADDAAMANKPDRALLAKKRAASLETRVAKLTIEISPAVASLAGLEVRRDGKIVAAPQWGSPIPVDSGDHIVTVTAPKKKAFEKQVWAEGTSKLVVSVAALEEPKRVATKRQGRSKAPAIALGVVGGVGVLLGATFVGLRASSKSDANKLHDKIRTQNGNCVGGGAAEFVTDCRALTSATSDGDTFGTTSLVGFIVGGVALGGMVTYLLLPEPARSSSSASSANAGLRFSPIVGPGAGGLVASGVF